MDEIETFIEYEEITLKDKVEFAVYALLIFIMVIVLLGYLPVLVIPR